MRDVVAFGFAKAQENAYRGEPTRNGARRLAALRLIAEVGAKIVRARRLQRKFAKCEKPVQVFQVASVGKEGVFRQAALAGQVDQQRSQVRAFTPRLRGRQCRQALSHAGTRRDGW